MSDHSLSSAHHHASSTSHLHGFCSSSSLSSMGSDSGCPDGRRAKHRRRATDLPHSCSIFHKAQRSGKSMIRKLVSRMESNMNDSEIIEECYRSLGEWSTGDAYHRSVIASTGGITSILRGMRLHPNHAGVQKEACLVLGELYWGSESNMRAFCLGGGVEVIRAAMSNHASDDQVRENASRVLEKIIGASEKITSEGNHFPTLETLPALFTEDTSTQETTVFSSSHRKLSLPCPVLQTIPSDASAQENGVLASSARKLSLP